MSDFIRALNLIKTRRNSSWLTDSQREALQALQRALRLPGSVNLCGSPGVGKTFLAWTLADELGYTYFSDIHRFTEAEHLTTAGVILDNCRAERQAHRNTLKALHFRDVHYAVLITREIVCDYTRYVELRLTQADRARVWDNLTSIGLFRKRTETPDLWHLVNPHR